MLILHAGSGTCVDSFGRECSRSMGKRRKKGSWHLAQKRVLKFAGLWFQVKYVDTNLAPETIGPCGDDRFSHVGGLALSQNSGESAWDRHIGGWLGNAVSVRHRYGGITCFARHKQPSKLKQPDRKSVV